MGSIMSRNLVWGRAEFSTLRVRDMLLPVILTGSLALNEVRTGRGYILQTTGKKAKKQKA